MMVLKTDLNFKSCFKVFDFTFGIHEVRQLTFFFIEVLISDHPRHSTDVLLAPLTSILPCKLSSKFTVIESSETWTIIVLSCGVVNPFGFASFWCMKIQRTLHVTVCCTSGRRSQM